MQKKEILIHLERVSPTAMTVFFLKIIHRSVSRKRFPQNLRSAGIPKKVLPAVFLSTESHPSATSSTIITLKPTAKNSVPILECLPSDISGISSSTTT